MGEIIFSKNNSYARYEELIVRRDNLRKEAFQYEQEYVREFGELILELFKKKMECIRKKKTMEYCQRILNFGGVVNQDELQEFLEEELRTFQEEFDALLSDYEASKKTTEITQMDLLKIKKIYHKLVKLIHPDMNPLVEENEDLLDLWFRVTVAYTCNNLKELEELEVLVITAIDSLENDMEIEITHIDERIAELEEQIKTIMETDPYMYKFILADEDAIKAKKESLNEEIKTYVEYSKQLDDMLDEVMVGGVTLTWRMN